MSQDLLTEVRDRVLYVTINMPETKNAVTPGYMLRLAEVFAGARAMDEARAVVLTGAPGCFCAGAKLTPDANAKFADASLEIRLKEGYHVALKAIWNCPKPVIAAIDGPAVGIGGALALVCDLRLGSDRARYGEVFRRIGLMSDGGGTFLLPRLVGLGRALELMWLGDIIDARTMLEFGLLNRLWSVDEFRERVHDFAVKIAGGPPLAYARMKEAVHRNADTTLDHALNLEAEYQGILGDSKDFMEGVAAWLQKRPAEFKGE
ncbi:MAG: enoyl-CoA hydratase/isomerase family protein [Myxococcales bacterium]|nr:enoyl-CoA hydratase/isomerase family protein [Myxococcales bacterium]